MAYRKTKRPILAFFIYSMCCLALIFAAIWMVHRANIAKVIPPEIKIGQATHITHDWLGLPGGGCSVYVYKLKASTARKIRQQGIDFFDSVSPIPPAWMGVDARKRGYRYADWVTGPLPQRSPEGNGTSNGNTALNCPYSEGVKSKLRQIARSPDSFYTYYKYGALVVSEPDQRVIYLRWR